MLKLLTVGFALFLVILAARADCNVQTVARPDGSITYCTTCCDGGNCIVTCY